MFHPRSSEFDPRVSAIVDHLRAIEKELGAVGKIAGRRASSGMSTATSQIVDAIGPILTDLTDRFRRGQRAALDEATSFGTEAVQAGARAGNDALDRFGDQAKQRPLFTMDTDRICGLAGAVTIHPEHQGVVDSSAAKALELASQHRSLHVPTK